MPDRPTLSPELLASLRCPETRQPLAQVDASTLVRIREQSDLTDLEGALVREDGTLAYPIRGGFPILLLDEAIRLSRDSSTER